MAAIWLLAGLLTSAIAAAPEEGPEPAPRIAVVTHVENETASITRTELARMFRKTQTEWEDGEHCIPIDQAGGDIRTAFGRIVLEPADRAGRQRDGEEIRAKTQRGRGLYL